MKIPQPRSLRRLIDSSIPSITSAEEGSEGYSLGVDAWNVISKNITYSEPQRNYIANRIAEHTNRLFEMANKISDSDIDR